LPVRGVKAPGRVFHGDKLLDAGLPVDLDTAEAGKQKRRAAVNHRAPIQLGDDLHAERQLVPRLFHGHCLRHGADEIAAKPDEGIHRAVEDAAAGLNRIETLRARRLEGILGSKTVGGGQAQVSL
jgi:hypothetical protein